MRISTKLTIWRVYSSPNPTPILPAGIRQRRGSPKGFEEADLIIENELSLPAVGHVPMETHVSIAQADPYANKLKIWSSTQSPFALRDMLAKCFSIPRGNIEVHVPYVGGGFGGRRESTLNPWWCFFQGLQRVVQ